MCDLLSQSKLGSNHMQFSFFFENIHTNTMYRYLNKNICINAKHLTCHLMTLVEVFHMTDDCMSEFLNTLYVQTYTCTNAHDCISVLYILYINGFKFKLGYHVLGIFKIM